MIIAELTILPVGTGTTSVSEYVAKAIKILEESKQISYKLNPMGTIVEAESYKVLYDVLARIQEAIFSDDVRRVYSVIKIDDRRDKDACSDKKIKSVYDRLGNKNA